MLAGRAADLFGRRRDLLLGLTLFTFFSLPGGFAQSGGMLIAARAAQGVGGAILAPVTLASSRRRSRRRRPPPGARRVVAAAASGAGRRRSRRRPHRSAQLALGPVRQRAGRPRAAHRGRRLADEFPGGDPLAARRAGRAHRHRRLGATGLRDRRDRHASWGSATTLLTLLGAAILLGAFAFIESRVASHPLVPLKVFRLRSLSVANGIAVTIGAGLFGLYYFLSLYLQQINDYSPLKAGFAFLPAGLTPDRRAHRDAHRRPARGAPPAHPRPGAVGERPGVARAAVGGRRVLDARLRAAGAPGIGFGFSFVPMTIAATSDVPVHQAGLALGLINTTRQVGGAVGLAIMATVAAGASSATGGTDRAFTITAVTLFVGAGLATLLPGKPRVDKPAIAADLAGEGDEIIEPIVAVEAKG